eukprot:TRINITY_DN9767_c0_g1_i1.p1 TRINITY_DN9767_c0_g1~~TRINITY_DN9767_c0_g1_i1.p1  ORF type:complete len:115 (+),score=13.51 TRINITY_DN9767_c0_g1_i1:55-399(+)
MLLNIVLPNLLHTVLYTSFFLLLLLFFFFTIHGCPINFTKSPDNTSSKKKTDLCLGCCRRPSTFLPLCSGDDVWDLETMSGIWRRCLGSGDDVWDRSQQNVFESQSVHLCSVCR